MMFFSIAREGLGLAPNMQVGVSVKDGHLVVEPHPRPKHVLADLVEQCDASASFATEDSAWLEDAPKGREAF